MATYYWGLGSGTWSTTSTTAWSDVPVINGVGARAGTLVTLTTGTTTGMVVGQKAYSGTTTDRGTVASIVNSTQFNTSTTGTVTSTAWYVGNQNSGFVPTATDDVVFGVSATTASNISIPTNTTVSCRNFTFAPRDTASVLTSLIGVTSGSVLVINGDIVLGSPNNNGPTNYSLSSSLLSTRFSGANNTFTRYGTTSGGGFGGVSVLGNYTQATDSINTNQSSSMSFNTGSWRTNNYALTMGVFTKSLATTFNFYCGTTVVTMTNLSSTPINMSNANFFNFYTDGGYLQTTSSSAQRSQSAVSGSSANPPNVKINCEVQATSCTISGSYGTLDVSNCACFWSASQNVNVQTFIGSSLNSQGNLTVTAYKGGGTLNFPTYTQPFTINHSIALGLVGTTTLLNWSSTNATAAIVITSGRLAVAEYVALGTSSWTLTGTNPRGIDVGYGATLNSRSVAISTINLQNPTNFTATGDFTFYLSSGYVHHVYSGVDSTGQVRWSVVAGSVITFPSVVCSGSVAPNLVSNSTFNSVDVSGLTVTTVTGPSTVYMTNFVGATSANNFMSSSGIAMYGTGSYNRNVQATGSVTFASDEVRLMPRGTTTLNSTVSFGSARIQDVDANGFNVNPGSLGNTVISNVATYGSSISATQGGLVRITAGSFTGGSISITPNAALSSTTLEVSGTFTALTSISVTAGTLKLLTSISRPTAGINLITSATVAQAPTLDLNNNNLTVSTVTLNGAAAANNITINGPGTLAVGAVTVTAFSGNALATTNGTAVISMTGATAKTFVGNGGSYGTLNQGGAGILTVSGSNTFADMTATTRPSTIRLTAGTTQTVSNFNVNGISGSLVTIDSSSASTQATLSKASGEVSVSYLSIKDSNATGGATWSAYNSTFVSNVTGWVVGVISNIGSRFMAFF